MIVVLSYLVGSIPTGIIVGKVLKGIDIRDYGSGSAGGTNVFRVLGWKPGVFVMLVDVLKGYAATVYISTLLVTPLPSEMMQILAGCAAIFGHIWTVFAGFRGGKGVGTAAGMLIGLFFEALLFCLGVFVLVLITTKIVSLGSMTAAVALPLILSVFKYGFNRPVPDALYIFSFIAAALIIYTHRSNIKRLLNGTENRIGRKKTDETG